MGYGVISPGKALVNHVYEKLTGKYGPSYLWYDRVADVSRLPVGLRMEMHPSVRQRLLTDVYLGRYGFGNTCDPFIGYGYTGDAELQEQFRVPVKITIDLPKDTWRLVIITEEVISAGELPQEADGHALSRDGWPGVYR